ncbi:MAG: DUF3793 family protein [Lachnospiraceae bacterium]|nr:DUF3793 family protein [Lachnospiraceae bacterium]
MTEDIIIENCAPTLAGIKTGSLFSTKVSEITDINEEVRKLNVMLRGKGIRVIPLKKNNKFALIYVYRPEHLKKDLKDPKAIDILKKRGYEFGNPECCIVQLAKRLKNDSAFPHEIGLFLGYPPSDVDGFIKHPCEGVKCCGCWKVYSEPEKAKCIFEKFKRCTEAYHEMNKNGKSLAQLAVMTG